MSCGISLSSNGRNVQAHPATEVPNFVLAGAGTQAVGADPAGAGVGAGAPAAGVPGQPSNPTALPVLSSKKGKSYSDGLHSHMLCLPKYLDDVYLLIPFLWSTQASAIQLRHYPYASVHCPPAASKPTPPTSGASSSLATLMGGPIQAPPAGEDAPQPGVGAQAMLAAGTVAGSAGASPAACMHAAGSLHWPIGCTLYQAT